MSDLSTDLEYEQSPLGIDYSNRNLLRMNLNENLVLPLARLRGILAKCIDNFDPRVYPSEASEGEAWKLKDKIGRYCHCSDSSVGLGFGSDQIIDVVYRMELPRGKKIITIDPTYSMYSILAKRMGARISTVRLSPSTANNPFSLNETELIRECRKKKGVQILVLASPNNPTGIQYPEDLVRSIVEALPDVQVLVDEAYVEYGEYTFSKHLTKYQNLLIVRTFSKAFGMANLRLGYLLANEATIKKFEREFQYPYAVSGLAVSIASELLERSSLIEEYVRKTKVYREELINSLEKMHLSVVKKSDTNFVLVRSKQAKRIAQELLKYAVAVKYIPRMGGEREFLRITVGSREMNQRLLYSLRKVRAA